ncbi:MAG: SurA N-terminal domain-containing protein [Acidobacteria bacterium]|nr:SurA N-terminal domain-containing protein [Acidobacteriota bacterium]
MIQIDRKEGVRAIVQNNTKRILTVAVISVFTAMFAACGAGGPGTGASNETAANVNGKVIKMEEVDRAVKQQAQGQEAKMSPLELAGARLQVLQSLIEQEVMFQKAEKENLVPTEEEITAEVNKQKQDSRVSAEEFDKQMKDAGFSEAALRDTTKRGLAIKKLVDKITARIEAPKDKEITDLYSANPESFVKKRGVKLAAIVIDPTNNGQGDVTTNDAEANVRIKELLTKLSQPASDFAALAREYSEDPSKLQGGDLGYLSEDELKQNFGAQNAAGFMNPQFSVGGVTNVIPLNGKGYIFKLQERIEKEEALTLESPGVRQQIIDLLTNNRKQLLAASYQAIAMNEAKIENLLAKKVVENPNELSGARPAGSAAATPAAPAAATPAAPAAATPVKPAAATPAKTEAKPEAKKQATK